MDAFTKQLKNRAKLYTPYHYDKKELERFNNGLIKFKALDISSNSPKANDPSSTVHRAVDRSDGDQRVEVLSLEPRALLFHNFLLDSLLLLYTCKGIMFYKFNLDYVASIKLVVKLLFIARLLSAISISFSRLVNLLEVKHFISTSVKEIDIVQLGIVSQAGLKLLLRSSSVSALPHKLNKQKEVEGPGMIIQPWTLMTFEEDFLYGVQHCIREIFQVFNGTKSCLWLRGAFWWTLEKGRLHLGCGGCDDLRNDWLSASLAS
nr:hypothetical protein [Tanacetum cinerariifolium]